MKLNNKMPGPNAGVGVCRFGSFFHVGCFKDSGPDQVAPVRHRTGEEDAASLGFTAQECQVIRHQVFVAFGDVPARPFLEQAKKVGLEIAGNIETPCAG